MSLSPLKTLYGTGIHACKHVNSSSSHRPFLRAFFSFLAPPLQAHPFLSLSFISNILHFTILSNYVLHFLFFPLSHKTHLLHFTCLQFYLFLPFLSSTSLHFCFLSSLLSHTLSLSFNIWTRRRQRKRREEEGKLPPTSYGRKLYLYTSPLLHTSFHMPGS